MEFYVAVHWPDTKKKFGGGSVSIKFCQVHCTVVYTVLYRLYIYIYMQYYNSIYSIESDWIFSPSRMHHIVVGTAARNKNILFQRESSADCVFFWVPCSSTVARNENIFFSDGRMPTELFPSPMHDSSVL